MSAYNQHAHDAYIKSEKWKCDQSPTGAHHWIGDYLVLKCKYCGESKKVEEPLSVFQIKANAKKDRHTAGTRINMGRV